MRAVGVTKFCCPICGFVLKNLKLGSQFMFSNSHNIISPCSLPPTLPLDVIKAAVAQFGGQLREELAQLMMRTDMLESCDDSINSKDLSTESFGSQFMVCAEDRVTVTVGHSESSDSR
jgi:hypothetical protein